MSTVPEAQAPPSTKGPGARSFGSHSGRKIKQGPGNSATSAKGEPEEKKEKTAKVKKITDMDEIDRMLENDAMDLMNMKKDLVQVQEAEIHKSQRLLNQIQRQYDTLHIANNLKEKEHQSNLDAIKALKELGDAGEETSTAANDHIQSLQDKASEVMEDFAAEERTIRMQELMFQRLDNEIVEIKAESAELLYNLEQAKHEFAIGESLLRMSKQEVLEEERILEQLTQNLRARRDQREDKMVLLHSIVMEGENSIAKIQQATLAASQVSKQHFSFSSVVRG